MKISVITMLRFHLFNLVEELSKFDNEISLHTPWRSEDAHKRFTFWTIKINELVLWRVDLYQSISYIERLNLAYLNHKLCIFKIYCSSDSTKYRQNYIMYISLLPNYRKSQEI